MDKVMYKPIYNLMYYHLYIYISGTNRQNPFSLHLVKNELGAVSESLGPPLSRPYPIMTIAGL